MLISRLPVDSAYVSACRGGSEYRGWTQDRYQTAELIDSVRTLTYLYLKSHAQNPKSVKPFEPSYRPGQKAPKTPKTNLFLITAQAELRKKLRKEE